MQVLPDGNIIVKNIGRPAGCPAQGYKAVTGAPLCQGAPAARHTGAVVQKKRRVAHMFPAAGLPCAPS